MNPTNNAISVSLENSLKQVSTRKYIVGSIDSLGMFSISSRPVYHDTIQAAEAESARLAKSNSGKAFVVMQFRGGAFVPSIQPIYAL